MVSLNYLRWRGVLSTLALLLLPWFHSFDSLPFAKAFDFFWTPYLIIHLLINCVRYLTNSVKFNSVVEVFLSDWVMTWVNYLFEVIASLSIFWGQWREWAEFLLFRSVLQYLVEFSSSFLVIDKFRLWNIVSYLSRVKWSFEKPNLFTVSKWVLISAVSVVLYWNLYSEIRVEVPNSIVFEESKLVNFNSDVKKSYKSVKVRNFDKILSNVLSFRKFSSALSNLSEINRYSLLAAVSFLKYKVEGIPIAQLDLHLQNSMMILNGLRPGQVTADHLHSMARKDLLLNFSITVLLEYTSFYYPDIVDNFYLINLLCFAYEKFWFLRFFVRMNFGVGRRMSAEEADKFLDSVKIVY